MNIDPKLLERAKEDSWRVLRMDVLACVLATLSFKTAIGAGIFAAGAGHAGMVFVLVVSALLTVRRIRCLSDLQRCSTALSQGKTAFSTLADAEDNYERAAHYGRMIATAVTMATAFLAACLLGFHLPSAALFALTALAGHASNKRLKVFANDAQVAKIILRNGMRKGRSFINAATLPGATALEKRYWFLKGNNKTPVATFATMYRGLRETGFPAWKAFGTALASAISFGPKTQKGMSAELKREMDIKSRFDIYIPNLIQAQGFSNTRTYATAGNTKGIKPGDVDLEEFELMFSTFAPGRDYLTARDFERVHEGNRRRDAQQKRGNALSRLMGKMASKRRSDQLLMVFGDCVAEEDGKLVPAASKGMLLRFYQGSTQYDLMKEHLEGDMGPSITLQKLAQMRDCQLAHLYKNAEVGEIPDGDGKGRAIILPGTFVGKLLSTFANMVWKGKVFDRAKGRLINKILGQRIIRAEVFNGESWSDGGKSIIIDYKKTSFAAFFIRDEIRQVQPGLYLGRAYIRLPFGKRFCALFFALNFTS